VERGKGGVGGGGRKVLLVNLNGTIYAYEDRCAHLGVALSDGHLSGSTLTCRVHQWEYDVCTGRGRNPTTVCLRAFAIRVSQRDILVDVAQTSLCGPQHRGSVGKEPPMTGTGECRHG
jgi:toluene monooxygenase system ferredoxin subunit